MQRPQLGTIDTPERLTIGKAAKHIGVSIDTLRRWEKKRVVAAMRSPGGHRYFLKKDLENLFDQKYTRAEPTIRSPKEEIIKKTQVDKVLEQPKPHVPEIIDPPLSEPINPPQTEPKPTPQPIVPSETKQVESLQQSIPAQDTPASFPTATYQNVSETPTAGLEQKAKEIVSTKKRRSIPWTKALIIGLIIFGVIDVILFIVFLTSPQTPISPIP